MKMSLNDYGLGEISTEGRELVYADNGIAIFITHHGYDNCSIVAIDENKNVDLDEDEMPEWLSFDDLIIKRKTQGD